MIILQKILGPLLYTPGLPGLPKDAQEAPSARSEAVSKAAQTALAPVPAPKKSPRSFQENFLKRLSQEEQNAIQAFLKEQSLSQEVLAAFVQENWRHPVFQTEEWPLLAVQAYLQGDLDEMKISKLFLFAEAGMEKDFELHQLRGAEGFEPKAAQLLLDGLKLFYSQKDLENLAPLEPKDTQFFSFRIPLLNKEEAREAFTRNEIDIANFGIHILEFPILSIIHDREIEALVIPPKLWNAILKSRYGENAIAAAPGLGYSSEELMTNPKERIVGIPSVFTDGPEKIHDSIRNAHLSLFFHDLYHTLVESANPHRDVWIKIAQDGGFAPKLTEELYDRNFILYASPELQIQFTGRSLTQDCEKFWYSLASFPVSNVFDFADSENRKKLLKVISRNEQEWTKYNISLASLRKCYEDEPKECFYSLKPWVDTLREIEQEHSAKKHKAPLLLPPVSLPKKRKPQPAKVRFAFH